MDKQSFFSQLKEARNDIFLFTSVYHGLGSTIVSFILEKMKVFPYFLQLLIAGGSFNHVVIYVQGL